MALTQVKALGIAADSIDESKIADNGIDSEHYNDGSIDHEHLADDAVDGDIIADNAVGLAHMAGGTDGVIITYDASGNPVHVGPGNDGQVLTSTGAGSPPAFEDAAGGAALTGSTNNTVVTVTGSNAMQGEANLTFDGTTLGINNPTPKFTLTDSDTTGPPVCLVDGSGGDLDLESDINNAKTSSKVRIFIDGSEKIRFQTAGGMSFNGDTAAANALDDYEEGTITATCNSSVTLHSGTDTLAYTKIGRMVFISGELRVNSDNSNANFEINNLPFASSNNTGGLEDAFNTCGSFVLHSWNVDGSNDLWGNCFMTRNTSTLQFKLTRDNGAYSDLDADSDGYIAIGFSYMAAT